MSAWTTWQAACDERLTETPLGREMLQICEQWKASLAAMSPEETAQFLDSTFYREIFIRSIATLNRLAQKAEAIGHHELARSARESADQGLAWIRPEGADGRSH